MPAMLHDGQRIDGRVACRGMQPVDNFRADASAAGTGEESVTGPAVPRLCASLLIGLVLAGVYWVAIDLVVDAMLAEAETAQRVMVAGRR